MVVPAMSERLIEWANRAGMSYSVFESTAAACFSSGGGEDRYYIRQSTTDLGWYVVTKASRNDDEWVVFEASELVAVEKYFWATFGADIRAMQRLPRLEFPTDAKDVAPGYSIELPEDGKPVLVDASDKPVVRAGGSDITDIFLLVEISYCLSASPSDLEHSFVDPQGRPMFPIQTN
jgi:hypothetical protein